jgi:hypothetical protein
MSFVDKIIVVTVGWGWSGLPYLVGSAQSAPGRKGGRSAGRRERRMEGFFADGSKGCRTVGPPPFGSPACSCRGEEESPTIWRQQKTSCLGGKCNT